MISARKEAAMDWKARRRGEVDVLRRIVAWLLALADLAESAVDAPHPVRCRMLWALQQADEVVREFVAGSVWNPAGRQWSPAVMSVTYGNTPADAASLALSLRALALVVQTMAMQARHRSNCRNAVGCDGDRQDGRPRTDAEGIIQTLSAALADVELHDTS